MAERKRGPRKPAPANSQRDQAGRFLPGISGNPAGKPLGARHGVTRAVERLLEGQHEALTQKAISKALEGDTVALRLCLDRLAPPRKDAPISFAMPAVRDAADLVDAGAAVMAALANGDATPDEAGRVMALLAAQRGLIETADLERRITALETSGGDEQ